MDDVRRNALVVVGAVFMAGAIAWISTVSLASGHSGSVRVLVPVVMFVVGAALVVWAVLGARQKPNEADTVQDADPKLDALIADGHRIAQEQQGPQHDAWRYRADAFVRGRYGDRAARALSREGTIERKISHLEGLRGRQ